MESLKKAGEGKSVMESNESPKTLHPSSSTSTDASKSMCVICLSEMKKEDGKAIFTGECYHSFHFGCIIKNVEGGNRICPICRFQWTQVPMCGVRLLERLNWLEKREHALKKREHALEELKHALEKREHGVEELKHGMKELKHGMEKIKSEMENELEKIKHEMENELEKREHGLEKREHALEKREHTLEELKHGMKKIKSEMENELEKIKREMENELEKIKREMENERDKLNKINHELKKELKKKNQDQEVVVAGEEDIGHKESNQRVEAENEIEGGSKMMKKTMVRSSIMTRQKTRELNSK